jgi:CP family cyanate transporter-like MFS transporter
LINEEKQMDKAQEMEAPESLRSWRQILTLALILLVGINLRTVLLGVPPILPLISHDLHLSYTETGLITSLPTLIMGAASLPAGILIGRLGGRLMVAFGLLLLAVGAFLRAFWPAALPLYFFTALLSLGSTFSQTAVPSLIRQWFSTRIGFATALYTDGLVTGETLGAVLTLPLLGWLGRDAWAGSFIFWGIPVVITLVLWLWLAPLASPATTNRTAKPDKDALGKAAPAPTVHKPARINSWALGLLLGGAQLIYFGLNTWTSSYNLEIHASSLTPLTLGALNAAQLPTSLIATMFADKLVGRRLPFIINSAICLIALVGWVWTPIFLQPVWAAALGGATILMYTLGLALPALLVRQEEVARLTGTMLSVGYIFSFFGPFIGGWFHDITHISAIVFLPMAIAAGLILILGILLPIQKHAAQHQ